MREREIRLKEIWDQWEKEANEEPEILCPECKQAINADLPISEPEEGEDQEEVKWETETKTCFKCGTEFESPIEEVEVNDEDIKLQTPEKSEQNLQTQLKKLTPIKLEKADDNTIVPLTTKGHK